jgi:hypothetical protein
MSTEITINQDIVEINVTEEVVVIEAPSGAYPLPTGVYSVFGRTGNVVAQEGDYTLTQLGDVTITSPSTGQVLKYNGTTWVNGTDTDTGLTSVGLSMPSAFSVANSPLTANGTLSVTGAGTTAQYVRGDGTLATFPTIAQEAQRLITEVYNSTGATLTKGTVVYINGGQGNLPTVTKAIATGDATSAQTYGVVQSDITNMNNGFVVAMGSLTNLDTQIYPVGTQLYLSATTAGAWTSVKQYAPNHLVYVGIVVRSHPTQGVVEIRIQNGYELDELHDVSAQSPTNGDILQYVAATDLWTKAAGTTTNIAEGTNLYFTDARARAAISLTTTGTSGAATYSGGTLNIPQYQGVLTNPVTGTGTTNTLPKFTGTSAIGNSNITDDGSLITLGSNSVVSGNVTIPNASYYRSLTSTATTVRMLGINSGNVAYVGAIDAGPVSTIFNASSTSLTASFYTSGTEKLTINSIGSVGIGTTSLTGITLNIAKNLTGATASTQVFAQPIIQSDVTGTAIIYNAFPSTQAAAFTINNLYYYQANQSTIGAASAINTQVGFRVASSLTGATNNFAFRSELAAATNVWNLYMNGTAANYLAGALLVGTTTDAGFLFRVNNGTSRFNGAAFALPSSSGTTQTGLIQRIGNSNSLVNIDMGGNDSGGMWLQVANSGNLAATYPLMLNPISGQVLINTSTTSAFALDVNGTARVSGQLTANSFVPTSSTIPTNGMYLSGTNTLGFATNGTLDMVLDANGALGIGTTSLTNGILRIGRNITGSSSFNAVDVFSTVQSDVVTSYSYRSVPATQAATFSTDLIGFFASQGTIGAGSTITSHTGVFINNLNAGSVYGVRVLSSNSGSSTAQAFRGDLAAGTNVWNLFMNGTANNYIAGSLGIGTTSLANSSLRVSRNGTGGTAYLAIDNQTIFQSDVTATAVGYNTFIGTQATTFTLNALNHYRATQGTFGAGSTITNQFGFLVDSTLIGATNNYGFYGNIPAATNRWNLYMNGTANNYLAGSLAIGTTTITGYNINIFKSLTGATTSLGVMNSGTVQSDVTLNAQYYSTFSSTQATTFTLSNLVHYRAHQGTFGVGSTVTNQYGFIVESSLIGATNNYGFFGNIASGTNRWNLYMAGTAANFMAGNLNIGATTSYVATKLVVSGSAANGAIVSEDTASTGSFIRILADTSNGNLINYRTGTALRFATSNNDFSSFAEAARFNSSGSFGIGTGASINASARLQVDSTTQGFLPPRMTTTQKLAIGTPAAGLMVYDTTLNQMSYYNGTTWINF